MFEVMNMSYKIVKVPANDIRVGDVIICKDRRMRTVCAKDITRSGAYNGVDLFGYSYMCGLEKVDKVVDLKF